MGFAAVVDDNYAIMKFLNGIHFKEWGGKRVEEGRSLTFMMQVRSFLSKCISVSLNTRVAVNPHLG
jgi:hypothetical protein